MPTSTYDLIASSVLGSSASSVTFSSIPATYRDLVLIINLNVSGFTFADLQFNGDSGSNYSSVIASGDGSNTSSFTESGSYIRSGTSRFNSVAIWQIMDYSATDKHKSVLSRHSDAGFIVEMRAHRWANTAAVNQVTITNSTYPAGSTFYLYGIVS